MRVSVICANGYSGLPLGCQILGYLGATNHIETHFHRSSIRIVFIGMHLKSIAVNVITMWEIPAFAMEMMLRCDAKRIHDAYPQLFSLRLLLAEQPPKAIFVGFLNVVGPE